MARAKIWLDVHGPDLHRYGAPVTNTRPTRGRRIADSYAA
jgi:hypothetical protein